MVSAMFVVMIIMLFNYDVFSQNSISKNDSIELQNEMDFSDIAMRISRKDKLNENFQEESRKSRFALLPNIGYSLQTGIQVGIGGNATFYEGDNKDQKISNILYNVSYCQYHQFITIVQGNIWTKNNKYNIVTDWRYLKFPQKDFGLGMTTSLEDEHLIDYSYLRFYQTILQQIKKNVYVGIGYNLDYHWNISETPNSHNTPTDFSHYGDKDAQTISSGITLNFLYDNRLNSINPEGGFFANIIFRPNFIYLGSDENWQTILMDIRKYFRPSSKSKNVLAFWTYNTLTFGGNTPYFDLPNTGGDEFSNTGRGYIQSRFRGRNMFYVEAEYRFKIIPNDFLGGVVFTNAQSFSEWPENTFQKIYPAVGAGIRIKMNKHSRTNAAIDYAFGLDGNQGLFVNLGECF